MGYCDYSTFVLLQMVLKPCDGLCIQMVGRLIQKQDIRLLKKKAAQCHTSLFTTGENCNLGILGRTPECIHSQIQLGIQIPGPHAVQLLLHLALPCQKLVHLVVGHLLSEGFVYLIIFLKEGNCLGNSLLNHFLHCLFLVQLRLLLKISDGVAGSNHSLAVEFLVHPCQDLEEG